MNEARSNRLCAIRDNQSLILRAAAKRDSARDARQHHEQRTNESRPNRRSAIR
jgi:hypothetical protein